MKQYYIQSFYQYPVTFSSIGKTIPARNAVGEMKNIAEVSEAELQKLRTREPFFRELENKKRIRVLNHIPESYVPPAQQINAAHEESDKLRAENEALKARIAALEAQSGTTEKTSEVESKKSYEDMTYAELQEAAKAAGIDYKNVKKADLIKKLEAFLNQ